MGDPAEMETTEAFCHGKVILRERVDEGRAVPAKKRPSLLKLSRMRINN